MHNNRHLFILWLSAFAVALWLPILSIHSISAQGVFCYRWDFTVAQGDWVTEDPTPLEGVYTPDVGWVYTLNEDDAFDLRLFSFPSSATRSIDYVRTEFDASSSGDIAGSWEAGVADVDFAVELAAFDTFDSGVSFVEASAVSPDIPDAGQAFIILNGSAGAGTGVLVVTAFEVHGEGSNPFGSDNCSFTPTDTPTFTPTFTPSFTLTFTPTFTNTPTNTFTSTFTNTPTFTFTPSFTPTFTPSFTSTFTPSFTPFATLTFTPVPEPTIHRYTPGEAVSQGIGTAQFLGFIFLITAVAFIWLGAYLFRRFRRMMM